MNLCSYSVPIAQESVCGLKRFMCLDIITLPEFAEVKSRVLVIIRWHQGGIYVFTLKKSGACIFIQRSPLSEFCSFT